jgi:alkanesulfonate monooxygenase SsuD/methylene tetrahydromethanopterin reductase-like flavin-dependent oxidoreductase (luciferase family)
MSISLPLRQLQLEQLEEDVADYSSDAKIARTRPPEDWTRARELTARARARLVELGVLYDVDLADVSPPPPTTHPLWMLAGPSNPQRQRAEQLRTQVDEDLAALEAITQSVGKEDRLRIIERRLDAEDAELYRDDR